MPVPFDRADLVGIAIAALALVWAFRILRAVPSLPLAWGAAAASYGIYLGLAVGLCGYDAPGPVLAPLPLFLALAAAQWRDSRRGTGPVQRRRELDAVSREIQLAVRRDALRRRAQEGAPRAAERALLPFLSAAPETAPRAAVPPMLAARADRLLTPAPPPRPASTAGIRRAARHLVRVYGEEAPAIASRVAAAMQAEGGPAAEAIGRRIVGAVDEAARAAGAEMERAG
jgi:hypothetical protein